MKISCDKTITNIGSGGTVYTQTNFLTLRYVTDSWGTDLNGFKMIITAFKDAHSKGCRDGYKCEDADICIHNDLVKADSHLTQRSEFSSVDCVNAEIEDF